MLVSWFDVPEEGKEAGLESETTAVTESVTSVKAAKS
jgi:hypothetical protein